MRNRLLQLVLLLTFAATALPGSAGLHWMLGLEHHHSHFAVSKAKSHSKFHTHAGCKHHHHESSDESIPTPAPQHSSDECSICDYFSQPISAPVAFAVVSVELAPIEVPLAAEEVLSSAPLATPPARGPPSAV